jgi:hypothetical protein
MSKFVTTIDTKGPFFTKDVRKTLRANIRDLMDAIAAEAEADIKAQLRSGEGSRLPLGGGIRPGRVSAHVVGRTHNLAGKPWQVTAVTSVTAQGLNARQAVKLMAAGSRLEGQGHAFRRTTGRIRRSRAVNTAELLKGLT